MEMKQFEKSDVGQQGQSQHHCYSCQVTGCSHREETQQQSTATSSSPPKQVVADKRNLVWFNRQWEKKKYANFWC